MISIFRFITLLFLFIFSSEVYSQLLFSEYEHLFISPKNYVVPYTFTPLVIDGTIDEAEWNNAHWSTAFEDIEGDRKTKPYYNTRVKMLWDNHYLYIAAELEEPHIWATLTKKDTFVFHDNAFEVFIDPNNSTHNYFEIQVNPLNTIFDLFLTKPYRNRGSALSAWDAEGLLHAIKIKGTLNNPSDIDKGWTVEMAIPFAALTTDERFSTPKNADIWRVNFSRVEWEMNIVDGKYIKRKNKDGKLAPENNWVWSPQGVINMHFPERWGYLQFSKESKADYLPQFEMPYIEKQKQYLWLIYYKQKDFKTRNKRYARTFSELGMKDVQLTINSRSNKLSLLAKKQNFEAYIKDSTGNSVGINEEGLILK